MLIFIPILAMLLLEFVVPGKKRISIKTFFIVFGLVFLLFLGIRTSVPSGSIYPEGEAISRVRGEVSYLLHKKDWQKKPVFILEGSSATAFGVNGRLLEKFLLEKGIDVTVLQLSLSGASHFERLFMLRLFLEELGKTQSKQLQKAPGILFSEVFDAYDQNLLYLFSKEAYTQRTMTWMTPSIAWNAWKSRSLNNQGSEVSSWMLLEHLFLNQFSVGQYSSMLPLNYQKKMDGFFPLSGTKKGFDYKKVRGDFKQNATVQEISSQLLSKAWKIYYDLLYQDLSGVLQGLVFYALPTLEVSRRSYQYAFAAHLPPQTIILGPASLENMKVFLEERYWYDGVHPQGKGAVVMTQWLADQIAAKWPQIKSSHWNLKSTDF